MIKPFELDQTHFGYIWLNISTVAMIHILQPVLKEAEC